MPRYVLRKAPLLKEFNHMLVSEHLLGGLVRQEEVSMIPPAVLDVQAVWSLHVQGEGFA